MIEPNPITLLREFVYGIIQAEGAASQMVHQHHDPRWLAIRDILSSVKDNCLSLLNLPPIIH